MDSVRIDFALIPDEPLFSSVIAASQAITDEFHYNENIIDAKRFPPHVSLLITSISRERLGRITSDLEALAAKGLPEIKPTEVKPSYGGYVMLNIERSESIMETHEAILEIAKTARVGVDSSDPYGSSYIRKPFDPHISLAKIDREDQNTATRIGDKALGNYKTTATRSLDLCDIGENSERWEVLESWQSK